MKILNLYAGIGGNRRDWPTDVEVTAIELNPYIGKVYEHFFPMDKLLVCDAHQYLIDHYKEFDFIWSSPPCQSHSKMRLIGAKSGQYPPIMPDMSLYEEIMFLQHYADVPWVVENVKPYYKPLIEPTQVIDRNYFWANFEIPPMDFEDELHNDRGSPLNTSIFDLTKMKIKHRKDQLLRNCVDPSVGKYILNLVKDESGNTD